MRDRRRWKTLFLVVALSLNSVSLSRPPPPPESETKKLYSLCSSSSLLGRGSRAPLLREGAARRRWPPSLALLLPPLPLLPLALPLSLSPCSRRRLASFPAPAAKKGGGGQKKGPSLIPKEKPPYATVDTVMLTLLLVESYRRALGKPLIGGGDGGGEGEGLEISAAPRALYEFPCAVLAHDRGSCGEDEQPKFTYANVAAQKIFESSWGELVGMESRKSADLDNEDIQADRASLLARAATTGKAQKNYKGWRVSAKGTKFEIQDGVLFNVKSPSGEDVGQAVVFGHWRFEDGSEGGPNAPSSDAAASPSSSSPSSDAVAPCREGETPPPSLEAAEAAVAEQAAAVRALKDSGKANGDPEVSAAVGELLRLKGVVAGIKGE